MSRHMATVCTCARWHLLGAPEGRRDLGDFKHGGGTREDAEVWAHRSKRAPVTRVLGVAPAGDRPIAGRARAPRRGEGVCGVGGEEGGM